MGGKKSTISTSETKAEALVLQSSSYAVTVPVVGGVNRVAGNLLDYVDFTAHAETTTEEQGGKGGGGVETKNTTYTYTVSVIMSLGHGRNYAGRLWKGKEVIEGGYNGASVGQNNSTYAVPASGAMTYTMPNAATMVGQPFIVWEDVLWDVTLGEGQDYRISGATLTILQEKWRGKTLRVRYSYGTTTYVHAGFNRLGLSLQPGDQTQSPIAWMLSTHPERAESYPGQAYVHAQDYSLGSSASVDNHSFEVFGFGAYRYGTGKPDCNPAEFTAMLLTNAMIGAGMDGSTLEVEDWIRYCAAAGILLSPVLNTQMRASDFLAKMCELTNSMPVPSYDRIRIVPLCDVEVTGNGVTYSPNTTPLYDLNNDFWTSDPPVIWSQKQETERFNHFKIEYKDRSNYYNKAIAEHMDDGDVAVNGKRTAPTINSDWVCVADVGRAICQLRVQRSLNVTGKGTIILPWAFCLLEPCDLVRLYDPNLFGDDYILARVTAVREDEDGQLSVDVEDWPLGTASPTAYTTQVPGGYLHDYNVAPGNAAVPAIFEGPPQDAGNTGLEVMVATRGTSPAWGGCEVWVSFTDGEYKRIGTIYGGSRYGFLNGAVTAASTQFDVDGLATSDQLLSGDADDAQALETLCVLWESANPEFFAYQVATLQSAGAFRLTGLLRGRQNSPVAAHADNTRFVRIDDQIARSGPLAVNLIGKTIYVKLLSFNFYGRGNQSLADVSPYSYVITGKAASYLPGIGGKGIELTASSLIFQYPNTGSPSPASIVFTAKRKGNLIGTVNWSATPGASFTGPTPDTRELVPGSMSAETVTVTASITDAVGTYIDQVTIAKVREGSPGGPGDANVVGFLTNESATVAADSAGTVASFANAGGEFNVYFGLTDVTASSTYSVASETGVDVSINATTGVYVVNSMSADQGSATLRANFSGYIIDRVYNISKARGGVNAQGLVLQLSSQTMKYDSAGNALPSSQTINLTAQLQNLTGSANWTATRYDASGTSLSTFTVGGSGNNRTVTNAQFTAATAYVVVTATRTGFTDSATIWRTTDGAAGVAGSNAQGLQVLSTAQTFTFNGQNAATPSTQTITFVASTQNLAGTATWLATRYNAAGTSLGTVVLGGSGNTRTMTETQFGAAAYAEISATIGAFSDNVRVVRLTDGAPGYVSDLSNDAHTFPADSAGNVTSYTGAVSTFRIYAGLVNDTANGWTLNRTNGPGVTSTLSTTTVTNDTVTVNTMDAAQESSYVEFTATKGSVVLTKRFSLAKARSAPNSSGVLSQWFLGARHAPLSGSGVSPAYADIRLLNNGTTAKRVNTTVSSVNAWYSPTTASIGSSYWVRASKVNSGDPTPSGSALDTWLSLSATRSWALSTSTAGVELSCQLTFLIASDSSGNNIVGQGNGNLFAGIIS